MGIRLTGAGGSASAGVTIGDSITSGTANRILYENSTNDIAQSANLRFDGSQLTIPAGSVSAVSIMDSTNNDADSGWYFGGLGAAMSLAVAYNGTKYAELGTGGLMLKADVGYATVKYDTTDSLYYSSTYVQSALDLAGTAGMKLGKAGANTNTWDSANLGTGGVVIGVANGSTYQTPNYELDIRGGAGDATIQLSNTASGTASGNGGLVQLTEIGGNSHLQLKHQGGLNSNYVSVYVGGAQAAAFNTSGGSGRLTLGLTEMYGPNAGYNTQALFLKGDLSPDASETYYLGAYRSTANVAPYPFKGAYIGTEGIMIGATSGLAAGTKPNHELDIRGGAGNATIQLSNTASGSTSSDGALIDFGSAILTLNNQEEATNLAIGASTFKFSGSGFSDSVIITSNGTPSIAGGSSKNLALNANNTDEVARVFSSGGNKLLQVRQDLTNQNTDGTGNIGLFGAFGSTASPDLYPFKYGYIGDGLMIGATTGSGASYVPAAPLEIRGDRMMITTEKTPASASATGVKGTICWDASYIYVCTATDTWKRVAIATW